MESNTNDYQLKQGDKEYIFSTTVVEGSIRLSCKNPAGKLYSHDFTVSDLKSIDPIFNEIKSESDAIDYFDYISFYYKFYLIFNYYNIL